VICVRVEAGEGLGVWIGRAWPGTETHVIDVPGSLDYVTIDTVREILETWPATCGNVADAIQAAAWHGRRELIPARLHAMVVEE
jgi:hypothetical protein